jgi:DNA ligase (NAD+)
METLLSKPVSELSTPELSDLVGHLNSCYREGAPLVDDLTFDLVYLDELAKRDPENDLITKVQPDTAKGLILHENLMLSTNKAYEESEISAFILRCQKAAQSLNIDPSSLTFRVTPKLDGNACKMHNASQLVTRGDGKFGSDCSTLLSLGLKVVGDITPETVGEVIIDQAYFDEHLAEHYSNARNFVGGVVNSKTVSEHGKKALTDGAIHLVVFNSLKGFVVDADSLIKNLSSMVVSLKEQSPYTLDGTVIEISEPSVKKKMGSTSSFHNWQIAKKEKGVTAKAIVTGITWGVGRTGKISPVVQIEKTIINNVVISNVTAHHARNVIDSGIGKGALIQILRSGEVIPFLEKTIKKVEADIPSECPCCSRPTQWKNDFLMCVNDLCSERIQNQIIYHFKTTKVDLFGAKSVEKLVANGFDSIEKVHAITFDELTSIGFGNGQAKNLINELIRVKKEPLQDNHLLASLGISSLGRGSSEKLLAHHKIDSLGTVTSDDIIKIAGFGDLTSISIAEALQDKAQTLQYLLSLNFNLKHTSDIEVVTTGALVGVKIVFTGKMVANRNDMKADAIKKGAVVQSSVGKTDYLVCGQSVGAKKIESAKAKGVTIITEEEYFKMFP